MKKHLSRLFTVGVTAAMLAIGANAAFSDVKDNAWYKQYVDYASEKGLVNGVAEGVFSPDSDFTVAQCITVASRIHSADNGKEMPVVSGKWYDGNVKYCIDNGIIKSGQFDSYDRSITREEAVLILINAVEKENLSAINKVHGISDVAHDDESLDEILSFYNAGILGGSDEVGSFLPDNDIKRSEVSAILCRLINKDMRIKVDLPYVGQPRYLIDDAVMRGKWGIQSGWNYDNKYELDNITGLNNYVIGANAGQQTNINRPINTVKEGVVRFDVNVAFNTADKGSYVALENENRDAVIKVSVNNGLFSILSDGKEIKTDIYSGKTISATHTFIFRIDFNTNKAHVTIDDKSFKDISIPKGSEISRLAIGHDGDGMGILTVEGARCVADYRINENFRANPANEDKVLYGDWVTNADVSIEKIMSERDSDLYSAKMTGPSTASHSFEKIGAKLCFEANVLMPENGGVRTISLTDGDSEAFKIIYKNGTYSVDSKELRNVTPNVWTNIRVEADCIGGNAFIRINGKDCGTVPFSAGSIDGVKFINNSGIMWFDDVKVYQLFDHDDYPSVPVPAGDDSYNIGVNVCNLWRNGHCDEGYNAVAPFEELYPLIGLADEGLPELADWEIKQMAEHGIDFQHVCWYAPQADLTAPVKATTMPQIALNDGYLKSKYSEHVKFCIMWENANGAVTSLDQFKEFLWPYFKEYYFSDDRYYTIDNKPLMTIWTYKKLISSFGSDEKAKELLEFMREDIKTLGFDGMIIWLGGGATQEQGLAIGADAVYPYNYGTSGESGEYQISLMNSKLNNIDTLHFVPGVSVGFNAIGRHDERTGMISDKEHEQVCEYIKNTYLPAVNDGSWKGNTFIVSTWNEYTEGTYVAPNQRNGFEYIDNIRDYFTNAPKQHEDIIPSQKVKDRLRNIYADGFSPLRLYRLEEDTRDIASELKNHGVPVMSWDFSKEEDRSLWRQSHGIDQFEKTSSSLYGKTDKSDFGVMLNIEDEIELNINNTGAYYLHVRMKTSSSSMAELFFRNVGATSFTAKQAVSWNFKKSDDYVDYYIDLSKNVLWSGVISNVRFDPMTTGGEFDIQLIEFLSLPEADGKEIFFDTNRMKFDFPPVYDAKLDDYLVTANPRLGFFSMSHSCYEYNIDKGEIYVQSLFGDMRMTVGSSKCTVNGKETDLGITVTLRDGLPYIPIKKYMSLLGYKYTENGNVITFDTLDDSLRRIYSERKVGSWEFNDFGSTSSWQFQNCTGHVVNGIFILNTTGADPAIYCKNLAINLDKTGFTKITVGINYNCERPEIIPQMFFIAGAVSQLCEEASVKLPVMSGNSGGKFVELEFDMSQNKFWSGLLSQLRFDPYYGNGSFTVDYIRLS